MNINGALVLITSAGSSLGSTLAVHFAQLGAKIILCDTNQHELIKSWKRCQSVAKDAHYYILADHSLASIDQLFTHIETRHQTAPNVLINYWPSPPFPSVIDDHPTELFIQKIITMATSLFTFGQACAEKMRQYQTKGVIINMVFYSTLAERAGIENANSMVSGFTQSWARELTPFNIRVGGVIPIIDEQDTPEHWAEMQDELIRNTEYIVANEYFSGRVVST
ncbi:SDR family oxidoreductase [Vibrio cincinnatiensis]|jgi:NAD(P)-dependent dehydrogenase (short-subunit alcohol dehydrogenase family)|uniref:NAD(P)-dependent dehydrogenase, short-chain alcohol dehydrogenase family n=1 Tax=Vibrio cincinnatiensis DSM 19608 TaxID=1123491 RepID=A0A1T4MAG7_VIBCI|nr:SDR family oxidoreductase [Vibrio cincinnatiensis]MCG3721490.1 SDR family oxidoreductase [Vibrio cincinnatiensis]MCG3737160.1 SDR family oxidoreductase [Vibrio cincinnatiensis]MCG3738433.1 SDR family oxidoreductase [Vibrio cincinnatiensis]MCG3743506.1 SDR family oxidoreductase [Vibrio cincinnatiensis]MCG3746375.1 SDR family oxidoreductase [Vibrio cincinnatiensis]